MSPQAPLRAQISRGRGVNTVEVEFNDKVDPASITPATPSDPPPRQSFRIEGPNGPTPGTAGEVGSIRARFRFVDGPFPIGTYKATLFGDPDPANVRPTITSTRGRRLDGEPAALPSGDEVDGGNLVFEFTIVP